MFVILRTTPTSRAPWAAVQCSARSAWGRPVQSPCGRTVCPGSSVSKLSATSVVRAPRSGD